MKPDRTTLHNVHNTHRPLTGEDVCICMPLWALWAHLVRTLGVTLCRGEGVRRVFRSSFLETGAWPPKKHQL